MIPVAFLAPNEQRNLAGPIAITKVGAVREVPVDGGVGWLVEEGTTNLIKVPLSHSNWWKSWGSVVDNVYTSSQIMFGTFMWLDRWARGSFPTEVTSGQTYTFSAKMCAVNTSALFQLSIRWKDSNWDDLAILLGDAFTLTEDFRTYSLTSAAPEGAAFAQMTIIGPNNNNPIVSVKEPQFEQKPYATSFAHGDMGIGYSWTGTPHQSASVREISSFEATQESEPSSAYIRFAGRDGEIKSQYFELGPDGELTEPSLLLSPDGSFDANGPVSPTVEPDVTVVDGQYGDAWRTVSGTGRVISPLVNF